MQPTHGPADLRDHVHPEVAGRDPAEDPIGQAHDGVEMRTRDRTDREDDRDQAGRGGRRVLEQLQPDVTRREPLRGDAGSDDDRDQQHRADELGDGPPTERGFHQQQGRRSGAGAGAGDP